MTHCFALVSGKQPPGMIMYDCCKKVIAQMSKQVQFLIAMTKLADRLWQLTYKRHCCGMICRCKMLCTKFLQFDALFVSYLFP